jgi:hypothetical protein
MSRGPLFLAATLLLVPPVTAQADDAISWSLKVEECIARARQTNLPLMFWVLGRSASRDHRIESAQKRAFRDPLVVELSRRFVTVRLSRSRYRDQLEKWNLSPRTNLEIVFATPTGEKIDTLSPLGVGEPEVLARKMVLVFRHYREVFFETELRPKLEDDKTSDADLRAALKQVTELLILPADQCVVALLDRESLSDGVRKQVFETLAALSTAASVDALLKQAATDENARATLARCTPDAAERMLTELEGDDANLGLAVYRAVTRICRIRDVKPDRFWEGRNRVVKRKEIERVRRIVTSVAERWRERYAEYR